MRTLTKNKTKGKVKFALLLDYDYKYILDENGDKIIDYVDSETGEEFYRLEGEKSYIYDEPISIDVDVAYSGGEVRQAEYGINDSDYDATLVYMLNEFPITETTLIWINSEPKKVNGYIDPKSADYIVSKVIPSLNTTRVLLKRRVK